VTCNTSQSDFYQKPFFFSDTQVDVSTFSHSRGQSSRVLPLFSKGTNILGASEEKNGFKDRKGKEN
jgi:hypothetical protein